MNANSKYMVQVLIGEGNKKSTFCFSTLKEAMDTFKKWSDSNYHCALYNFV